MKNEMKKFGKLKLNKESLSLLKGGDLPQADAQRYKKTQKKGTKACGGCKGEL